MSEKVLTDAEIREILESAGWTRTFSSPPNVIDYQRSLTRTEKYNRILIYPSDLPRYKITRTKLQKLMAETNLSKHGEILLGLIDPAVSGPPVRVEEMRRALERMIDSLGFSPLLTEAKLFEAAMFAAKTTMKNASERRVFVQDFFAALNRAGLLATTEPFLTSGYVYMEAQ